jgi:hypothetical protein
MKSKTTFKNKEGQNDWIRWRVPCFNIIAPRWEKSPEEYHTQNKEH